MMTLKDEILRWRYFPRSPELIWSDRDERLRGSQTTSCFPNSDLVDFGKNYSINKKRSSNTVYSWSGIKWAPQGPAANLFHTGDIWWLRQLFDGPLFKDSWFLLCQSSFWYILLPSFTMNSYFKLKKEFNFHNWRKTP